MRAERDPSFAMRIARTLLLTSWTCIGHLSQPMGAGWRVLQADKA